MLMNTSLEEKKVLIKKELEKIKKENNPEMTGVKVRYSDKVRVYDVYKIPLSLLVYNKDNGRIGTRVKSHEKQIGEIDEYTIEGAKLIEEYVIDSKKDRNEKTIESLANNGQLKHGIVTSDGIIVDGNRRASLLNELYNKRDYYSQKFKVENLDFTEYFLAIILDEDITKKEIHRLETEVQMGEDEKVDYNPIEKYLKCRDLRNDNFTSKEIGKMMGESTQKINSWLELLELMDEYLDFNDYSGIYTMLDKREDLFITMQKDLKKVIDKKAYANWAYTKKDVIKLKSVGFDYIRCQYEGKEFRNLTRTSNDKIDGIFSDKTTWENFYDKHSNTMSKVKEDSVEKIYEVASGTDFINALGQRDKEFSDTVRKGFVENITRQSNKIKLILSKEEPYKQLCDVYDILDAIDTDSPHFYSKKVKDQNAKIIEIIDKFRFKLQKGMKNE